MVESGMNFLIYGAWNYGTESGGGIALHRLAHNLAALGHHARVTCGSTAPGWLGTPTPYGSQAGTDEIVIYPEVVEGNPASGVRVVRWLLNTPGFFEPGNGDGRYGARDMVVYWDEQYARGWLRNYAGMGRVALQLTAWRTYDHFRDLGQPRNGECYAVRKGAHTGVPLDRHSADSLCIDDYAARGGDDYLIRVFNEREKFVCYDSNTMLSTLANLCGCQVIGNTDAPGPLNRAQLETMIRSHDGETERFVNLCGGWWK